jgi:hyperosmotically inducible protein
MNTRSSQRTFLGVLIVLSCAIALPAWAAPPDPWITTRVKIALLSNRDAPGLPVNVDTNEGVVTLHGKVETAAQREAAARVARSIDGVREVRNLLQVVPDNRRSAVQSSDDRIRRMVDDALDRDRALSDSRIGVQSVNRGVVLLSGSARSTSEVLRALQTASRVSGVRRVLSEIQSPDRMAENWDDDRPDRSGVRTRTGAVSDSWITARTKMKYMTDPDIPAGDINVDCDNGRVTLFGVAPSREARAKAERLARQTSGVRSVSNQLRVVPPSQRSAVRHSDHEIENAVARRIDGLDLRGEHVRVQVKAGVARLTGTVQRPADRYRVLSTARNTEGVRSISDDLRVDASSAARDD